MLILVNCFLLMLAAVLVVLGISFYIKNAEAPWRINYYILMYCLSSALWCISYGLIGLADNVVLADALRRVGVFSIEIFLANEVFFVTGMFKEREKTILFLRTAIIILGVIDFFTFGQSGVDTFIRVGNWTTWTNNPDFRFARLIHVGFVLLAFATALTAWIVWAKTNTLKRNRRFIQLMFIANFLLIIFSCPDTMHPSMGYYAVPTSGIGAAGCALVVLLGATKLNYFDVRMGTIISKIYEFVNAGVIVFATDHHITMANPYAKGMVKGDIINCRIEDIFDLDAKTKNEIYTQSLFSPYSVNARGNDGKTYSIQINAVLDNYKEPYCFMCIFVDITEEINLINKLEVANNAKTSFLTSMSHEIRTPINAVVGFNEIIGRKNEDPEIAEYSEYIDRAAHHLLAIINNLLDMEQITVGKLTINSEDYDLSEVIKDAYSLNALMARDKGLIFKIVSAPGIPRSLKGDSVRLQQIILNLTTNAIKYTEKGSVTIEVGYKELPRERIDLMINVRDTGVGIKEEDRSRLFSLFERFNQDMSRHVEGTGLGLVLAKRLVEEMGGTITFESEYGKGSCFSVSLPQKVTGRELIGLDLSPAAGTGKKYKPSFIAEEASVLVVDDNDFNLMVAAGLMKPMKIKVDFANSGFQMLEVIKKKKYDIIFLDHLMPKMDGIMALKRMREDKTHVNEETPVIAMTANAIRGMKERFLEEGFTDFIPKPVEPVVLEGMIKKYLDPELVTLTEIEIPDQQPKALFSVEGIDIDQALSGATGMDMVRDLMETFCKSADNELSLLEEYYEKGPSGDDEESMDNYRIKVHAMKNSAATVGAEELSVMAKELEYAAREKNREYICSNHENYVKTYKEIVARLSKALFGEEGPEEVVQDNRSLLDDLDNACRAMKDYDTLALNDFVLRMQNTRFASEDTEDLMKQLESAIRDFDEDLFYEVAGKIRNAAMK